MDLKRDKPIAHSGWRRKIKTIHLSRHNRGFTLSELMTVTAIIGILLAIAVPSYTSYIARAQLNDGREDVYRVMAQQERYFLKNMAYATSLGSGASGIGYNVPVISPGGFFVMSTGACIDNTIQVTGACTRVTATGQRQQTGTVLWLESDGDKSPNL